MAFTGTMEDRLLIRELYDRYTDASWRNSPDEWLSCFTEDGKWTSHLFNCSGKQELLAEWNKLWADWECVGFYSNIGAIEINGDSAHVRSYVREIVQLKSGGIFKLAGAYEDQLRRVGNAWLFARRDYTAKIMEPPAEG